jgi:hypothetical protein
MNTIIAQNLPTPQVTLSNRAADLGERVITSSHQAPATEDTQIIWSTTPLWQPSPLPQLTQDSAQAASASEIEPVKIDYLVDDDGGIIQRITVGLPLEGSQLEGSGFTTRVPITSDLPLTVDFNFGYQF